MLYPPQLRLTNNAGDGPRLPQATTLSSARTATLNPKPAAMCTILVASAGTSVWPTESLPQAATEPSPPRTRLCKPPAATATALDIPTGTVVLLPHAAIVPSASNARLCIVPAAISTTLDKPAGGAAWPTPLQNG